MKDYREWYKEQADFEAKEIGWSTREIERLTKRLNEARKKDREMLEWVWGKGVMAKIDMEIWGDPKKYESAETHKLKLERRREYLKRKRYEARKAYYERMAEA